MHTYIHKYVHIHVVIQKNAHYSRTVIMKHCIFKTNAHNYMQKTSGDQKCQSKYISL